MYLNVFSLRRRQGAASVCVYRTFAITFHLDGLQVPAEDGGARDMKTISYRARTLALIRTDTPEHQSKNTETKSRHFDPAPRIIELVLSLRPLGWRSTRSFRNLCLIYEGLELLALHILCLGFGDQVAIV
jgi:hypothetical protein